MRYWNVYGSTNSTSDTHYYSTASDSATNFNGWYLSGKTTNGQYSKHWRIQYAYLPEATGHAWKVAKLGEMTAGTSTADTYCHIDYFTVDYAPLDEFSELEPERFQRYMKRMHDDPAYREQQLQHQDELFRRTCQVGLWAMDGLELLHRIFKQRLIDFENVADMVRYGLQDPTVDMQTLGQAATTFLGVPARFEELRSLRVLFDDHDDVQLKTIFERFENSILHRDNHGITADELKVPTPVTLEQITKASHNADRLLRTVLSPEEYDGLIKDGHVRIQSPSDPECIYIVKREVSERIEVHKKGKLVDRLCVSFKTTLPNDDLVLAKIQMCKQQESELLSIANHFPLVEQKRAQEVMADNDRQFAEQVREIEQALVPQQ